MSESDLQMLQLVFDCAQATVRGDALLGTQEDGVVGGRAMVISGNIGHNTTQFKSECDRSVGGEHL